MTRSSCTIALVLLSLGASPLHATSTLVPDHFATIQLAIDSGADTVIVKGGTYDENLVASGDLVLLAYEPHVGQGSHFELPIVGALTTAHDLTAIGLRFRGLVTIAAPGGPVTNSRCVFESCRFDAGITTGEILEAFLYVRGCTFLANSFVVPYSCEFLNNAFIGAYLDIGYEGFGAFRSNVFSGPGDFGLRVADNDGGLTIAGNRVSDRVEGIILETPLGADFVDNQIFDCSSNAIRAFAPEPLTGSVSFLRNEIRDCGGNGVLLDRVSAEVVDNIIDEVGGDGLQAAGFPILQIRDNEIRNTGGHGINVARLVLTIAGNRIHDTAGDGIVVWESGRIDANIVARAGGVGIRVTDGSGTSMLHNTIYDCTSHGIELTDASPDSIRNNIAYRNGGAGFAWLGAGTPHLACNDWFDNAGGATSGMAPGATDLSTHPLFCDIANDDVSLSAASPLVNAAGCGQIGALGQGCTVAVGVAPEDAVISGLAAYPQPARGRVTFAWTPTSSASRIDVYDVTGARRWSSDIAAGARTISWDFSDASGRRLAPGVYLVRFEGGGVAHARKVSLAR